MRAKVLLFLLMLVNVVAKAQTNPAAATLPYNMTSASGMPPSMATWRFGTSASNIPTFRTTAVCNGDLPAGAGTTGGYSAEGANGLAVLASGSNAAGAIVLAINTTGLSNITVTWTGRTIANQSSRDMSLGLQYRIGTTGSFTDVTPLVAYQVAGPSTPKVEILPAAANNQPLVQIRWVYWEHAMNSGGSRDRLAVDDINVVGSAAGCSTVNPGSISSSTGTNICGASTNPILTLGGGVSTGTGITYQWESSTDGINYTPISGATSTTYAPGTLTTTTYFRAITTCTTSGAQGTASITININPVPAATISGTTTICNGGNTDITFSGTPNAVVTYNINGGANQTVTLDGTGNAIVNTGALIANATYNLVNVVGGPCTQALSGNAVVTVSNFTAAISGTATICSGGNTDITFTGSPNATVTYTVNGGADQTVTLDGTGNAIVNTGALTANATYTLVNVISGPCTQTVTGSVVVSINNPTAAISGTATICSGTTTNITFNGTPNAVVTYNINGGGNTMTTLNGAGTATLTTANLTANTTYNLVSVSLNSCSQSQSGSAVVTVSALPTATISGTATICSGTTTNITFNGTPNAVVTYNVNGGTNTTVTLNGAGTATVTTSVLTANTTYDLVSVSLNSCSQAQSGSALVTVTPLPTATINGTGTICSGNTVNITFNGTPNAIVTYNIDGGASQTVTLDAAGVAVVNTGVLTTNTVYNLMSITGNGCGQALTGDATITVTPLPVATISGTTAICAGDNANITFNGSPNAVVGYNEDGGATQTITLDGAGNAALNTGALNTTKVFNLVNVNLNACGQNLTGVATVTVNPLPTASISGTTTICSGTDADITFTGTPNAVVTYNVNGGTNTTVTLDGTGNAVVNTGNLTAQAVYDLVSVNSGLCTANVTGTATVSVNIIPTASISGTTTICSGNSTNITFSGTPNAVVTYAINSGNALTVVLDGTGLATVSTGNITANATYSIQSVSLNTCMASLTGNASVTVLPAPVVTISGTVTLTAGNIHNITFAGTPNAVVTYIINGGTAQAVTLDATGNATVPTGVLYSTLVYDLVDVTLGCTTPVSGNATVTVSTSYSTLYSYTNDVNGDFNFVAQDAVATDLTLYNGATLSGSACPTGFTTENYSSTATFDPATNKGVTAKVSPDGYKKLVITGFTVGVRRSADGPQYVRLAYSVDNGANWISSGVDELPGNGVCGSVNTLTWNVTPFQIDPYADGIMFGVFGFDAATTTGQLQIVDMGVNGAVIDMPLPITLTYFKGNCFKGDITCKWAVSHESNIADYEVEYSADGKSFNKVATIAPYNNQQIGEKIYSTIIYNGAEGLYRLASVEKSGGKAYSKAVRVKCDDGAIAVPTVVNVIDGTLNMWPGSEFLTGSNIDVKLFNMNGAQVANYTISSNGAKQQVQVSLPAGVYMVRSVQGSTVSAHKVVIQ